MKRLAWITLLIPILLSGCTDQSKLAEDEAHFNDVAAAQQARLDRKLQDATVEGMLLSGAMSEHSLIVFHECRDEESKTPTCQRLYKRVARWEKKEDAESKAQLKADGVTP